MPKSAWKILSWICVLWSALVWTPTLGTRADDTPAQTETDNTPSIDEPVPDIEAKSYPIRVIRRNSSNKIYLLEDVSDRKPAAGQILLLKKMKDQEGEPYLAVRVMKVYPDQKTFAAKRIKRYGDHDHLDDNESLTAVEKVSELEAPVPTRQEAIDLKELEAKEGIKILPVDPELDTEGAPAVGGSGAGGPSTSASTPDPESTLETAAETEKPERATLPETETENENDDGEGYLVHTVEEIVPLDHNIHWLTLGFGYLRGNGPPSAGGSYFFSAGNIRYGISLGRMLFAKRANLQDSLTLEAGAYYYKAINFNSLGDAYTVLSVPATLRYNLLFSESLGMFFYAGLISSFVLAANQADDATIATLGSFLPAVGIGLLIQLGPNWFTRVDAGLDAIDVNLVLRF